MNNSIETLNFNASGRYSAHEAIDNFILGRKKAKEFHHQYVGDTVTPTCDIDNKIIYSPVLPVTINLEHDKIVRAKNEHEAGHGRLTPYNKKPEWSSIKGNLINALEDLRIERGVKSLSDAFVSDIDYLNQYFIERINTKNAINGFDGKPINEAILVMMMKGHGFSAQWQISELAKKLIELAETDFDRWKDADYKSTDGFTVIEKIADDILAKWSAFLKNEDESGNGNGNGNSSENNDNEEKQNGSSNQDSNEENNGESSSSDDNEENNGESSSSDDNEENNGESSSDNEENNDENSKSSSSKNNSSGDDSESSKDDSSNNDSESSKGGSDVNNDSSSINKKYYDDEEIGIEKELKEKMEEIIKESQKEFGEYRAFTDDDCVIKAEEKQSCYETAKSRVAGAISMFSGYLEQSLRSMSRCRKIGNRDRGILDVRALPAFAKNLTKNVFYTQKQGISLDTTVSILIDESGSMYECGKYLTCRSVAIALAEVLNRLDIKFEILGHTTGSSSCNNAHLFNRSSSMMIFEHKNFNESYAREKYRLGSIDQYNCNIDSEALLYTFKRAMAQRSNRHIIMVLSDGMPSGTRNREVGYKHLKKVVNFCRKNGAEVYAFGIQAEEPKSFYGDDYFVHLKNMDDFNTTFFRKVANIISKGKM